MPQPDLSKLSLRMRYAATVLEECQRRFGLSDDFDWTADLLRADAAYAAAEECRNNAKAEALAREMFDGYMEGKAGDAEYTKIRYEDVRDIYFAMACPLIDAGWRK